MTIKELIKQRLHDLVVELIRIITAPSFIQMVVGGALIYLSSNGFITADIANIIAGILGVSVVKGTVDKFSQAKLAAATNTTVSMPSTVAEVKTTTKKVARKADGRATVN